MTKLTVTIEDVTAAIVSETFTVLPDGRTTICQLTLKNGFTVDGHSACVSKEMFNTEKGNKFAREAAVEKVWAYLGWDLCTKLNLMNSVPEASGLILKVGLPTTYVGTKVVRAVPMTRLAYNELRGWETSNDENSGDVGYLVEYTDGGAKNVEGFAGYISWCPKDVFDRAHGLGMPNVPTSFADRLRVEHNELQEKTSKLASFLGSNPFMALPEVDRQDLMEQYRCMHNYKVVLENRIARLP